MFQNSSNHLAFCYAVLCFLICSISSVFEVAFPVLVYVIRILHIRLNLRIISKKYKVQRNLVVKINRMAKRTFYTNLDPMVVGKDKILWKNFKPFFSEQSNLS